MKISKKSSKSSYVIGFFAASLSIITIISAVLLSIPVTNAETTTSNASISVGMSCSMAVTPGTGGTATSDGYSYSATVTPGVPSEISGSILTTTCNGPGNYSLYAIGYSGDSYDTPTNTQMISSTGSNNIATGTATSGSTSNWAFKLASVSGTSAPTIVSPYSNYSNVPGDNFAKVATMLGTTGLASTSAVQAKYQVYASSTQPAGAYTGKVKYTMVYPNDAPAPTSEKTIADSTTMQEVNSCPATLTTEQIYTLIDTRDSEQYPVAKLADGKCWMLKNLNLDGGVKLSSDSTNVPDNYTTSTAGFINGDTLPSSSPNGFSDNNTAYVYNTNNTSCGGGNYCYSYYSWRAATAGYNSDTSSTNVDYDICPRGWKMPTDNDFTSLKNIYHTSSYDLINGPFQATVSYTYNPDVSVGGTFGGYWSSTSYSSAEANYLSYGSWASISHSVKSEGIAIRCITK